MGSIVDLVNNDITLACARHQEAAPDLENIFEFKGLDSQADGRQLVKQRSACLTRERKSIISIELVE